MASRKIVSLVACLILGLTAGAQALQCNDIGQVLHDNGFSYFSKAAVAANITGMLGDYSKLYTLFAPTDAAFEDFLVGANSTLADMLVDPALPEILAYHTVSGRFSYDMLKDDEALPSLMAGGNLTIRSTPLGSKDSQTLTLLSVESAGSLGSIVMADWSSCNVVLYGVNAMLLPESLVSFEEDFWMGMDAIQGSSDNTTATTLAKMIISAVSVNASASLPIAHLMDQAFIGGFANETGALAAAMLSSGGAQVLAQITASAFAADLIKDISEAAVMAVQAGFQGSVALVANQVLPLAGCATIKPTLASVLAASSTFGAAMTEFATLKSCTTAA